MLELYDVYDVVICGGGTSGCAAAISAARAGAKTLLIERLGVLGGQMNVSGPPGFAYAYLFNARYEQTVGGFAEETHNRLLKAGHALPHQKNELRAGYSFSYIDPDWFGLLMFEMMQENGVELQLHSVVVDVVMEDNSMKDLW
jgi:flavin-dependent dehydrogenase